MSQSKSSNPTLWEVVSGMLCLVVGAGLAGCGLIVLIAGLTSDYQPTFEFGNPAPKTATVVVSNDITSWDLHAREVEYEEIFFSRVGSRMLFISPGRTTVVFWGESGRGMIRCTEYFESLPFFGFKKVRAIMSVDKDYVTLSIERDLLKIFGGSLILACIGFGFILVSKKTVWPEMAWLDFRVFGPRKRS